MSELQPNSHKYRAEQKEKAATETPRAERVVKGVAKTKKKSEFSKLGGMFISEDAGNIKEYLLMDWLLPNVKKAIVTCVDMLLNGGHTTYDSRSRGGARVSYSSYYDRDRRDDRGTSVSYARNRLDFDDLIFESRGDAEAVLDELFHCLNKYGVVRVADLYDAAGKTPPYTANRYGWMNLRNAEVVRVSGGDYIIKLPKAAPLD